MSPSDDAFARGLEYLQMVRSFALEPGMVDVMRLDDAERVGVYDYSDTILCAYQGHRTTIYTWISNNIDIINAELDTHLQACHECFHRRVRRPIQIFATPLTQSFGIDAMCNIRTDPTTILIDVGQIEKMDWLSIVAHEYAHAHLGTSGHNQEFASVLCHLCLGLGLEPPTWEVGTMEVSLRSWPNCKSTINPFAFWMGEASSVKFR